MTDVLIEVTDLKQVEPALLKKLKAASFGKTGWMLESIQQILRGYGINHKGQRVELSYSEAHAVVAWSSEGEFLGWALVRHPRRQTRAESAWQPGKFSVAGRRSDFMVYIPSKHRRSRIARKLLTVAYHNFGRLDCYPWEDRSETFYTRNRNFVVRNHTNNWHSANFYAREIWS